MKVSTNLAAVALGTVAFLAAATPASAQARRAASPVDGPHLNTCHSGNCSWFDITHATVVRRAAGATLYRVQMREGNSDWTGPRVPTNPRAAHVEWLEVNGDTYIFCSTRRPAALTESSEGVSVTSVDPVNPDLPTDTYAEIYDHVCHPGVNMTPARARRLGYRGGHAEPVTIARVEDIFQAH